MNMRLERLVRLLILTGLLALQWASVPPVTTAAPAPAEDIPADWWAQVQEDIRQSEYHITWQTHTALPDLAAAYQAPNRAQNLRLYFTPSGVRVIPRTGDANWELGLSVRDAGQAELVAQERSIAYRRAALAETFTNTEAGLQHEVTLNDAATFDLALSGNLTPHIAADGASVEFRTASGVPVLRYGDFSTPVQLFLPDAHHLRLTLPISNLPSPNLQFHALLTALPATADWSVESNQADAQLGFSVAGAGDVNGDGFSDVLVGAPTYDGGADNEGRAYAYYGSANGLGAAASWTREIDQAGAQFGAAVAGAGDVNGDGYADVIIGAPNYANGQAQEGAAFVYHGSSGGLSATPAWQYESDKAGAHFGAAVSNAGYAHSSDYTGVLVGAPEFNETLANQGKAFVFYGNASGLNFAPDWSNAGSQTGARFGAAVSCAGDVDGDGYHDILIGAPGYDDNTTTDTGAAFIYHGSAGGIGAVPEWQVLGASANARLGASVSLAGDVNGNSYGDIIVGAPGADSNAGAAYVYLGASAGLTTTVGWSVTSAISNTQLGASVALAGDVDGDGYADVLVGAPGFSDSETGEGAAQLYSGSATGLSAAATWTHSPDQAGAQFGAAVAGAGDVNGDGYTDVLIGAPGYSHPESNEGSAFAFYGNVNALSTTPNWNITSAYAVSTAGDVNGDGYSDVIVGDPLYDATFTDAGRIFIYLGSANGLATTAVTIRDGDVTNGQFGYAVSTAGDVDGDGDDDILVGAPHHTNGEVGEGRAYVYFGNATGLEEHPRWYAEGNQAGARMGRSVACAGDVNGDGYSDIIIGTPSYNNDDGRAFIWLGNVRVKIGGGPGYPNNADWIGHSNQADDIFGIAVAGAGDVNGDGYSDVLVGASFYSNGELYEGAAFLYLGGSGAMSTTPVWQGEGNQADARYGTAVSSAGDVNGDGFSDFLVGARQFNNGQTEEGVVFVYHGSAPTISTTPERILEIDISNAHFGSAVSTAGDLNGDGYADVIVGAPEYREGLIEYGAAFVYYGSSAGLGATPDWSVRAPNSNFKLGRAVGGTGDVNGDGFNDLIVGTANYANVYYGNGGGMALRPRQLQPTGAAYLTPLGRTNAPGSVLLNLNGKTPLGHEQLKLEWQVAPLGQDFGGPGTVSGSSDAWTAAGGTLAQTITGLASSSAYHWRVRLRYRAGNPLGIPAGRWIHMPHNGWLETDFQTAPGALSVTATSDSPTTLGSATTLTATANATYVAYAWDFGDSATGSGKVVTHTYAAAGTYTATVTASNGVSTAVASTYVLVGDEPIAGLALLNDSPTAAGEPTHFTATVTAGGGITYTWDFADGSPMFVSDADNTVEHVYATPGNYVATVIARNLFGPVSATSPVTITDAPLTGLTATNDSPTALGQPTAFTATATGGGTVSYAWAFGDGTTGSGATATHTYGAVGTYTAIVTASNGVNSLSATTPVTITDVPVAGLTATNDSPTALGQPTAFAATVTGGGAVSYAWAFGDGTTGSGATATHTYGAVGTYTAIVTASNGVNSLSATTPVTITDAPVVEVIYVDGDATGPLHNGLSWSTAYTNVQAALDWTNAHGEADYEIWVAEGVYYPDEGVGHSNNAVTESFRIAWNNVQLYGGFAGDETARTQRDWTVHPTVLSGDIDRNDWNTDTNAIAETWDDLVGHNAYHVLWLDGATNEPLTEATVLDSFIITAGYANGEDPDFYGGGFYCDGRGAGSECSPTLNHVTFSGNMASTYGGAMYNSGREEGRSNPRLTNVTFSGNTSIGGGGMFNSASYNGESSPWLLNVTFSGNQAEYSCGGMSNSARGSTTIPNTGGVSSPTLINVVFSGNRARRGGAMGNDGDWYGHSAPTLINVTFSGNAASEEGGGILNTQFQGSCHPLVVNSILWGNTAPLDPQIHNHNNTVTTILYTDIQGGAAGAGNLNVDPQFVTPITATAAPTVKGNYHLQLSSPVIDAGHTLSVTVTTDRDGNPRVVDDVVDMGAYESQSVNTTPTLNIPDISMAINTTRALDLRDYADDNEDPTTVLTFTVASVSTGDFAATLAGDGHTLNLTPAMDWTGTATVTIQVTDPGQLSASDAFNVQVETPITGLQAANDSPVPIGQPVAFTATVAGGDNIAYTWAFGDGATGSGASVQHAYAEMGVYTAIVTASNQVSELSASTRVTITEVPLAGLAAVNDSPTPLDNATTFSATVSAGSGAVYTWAFGDGATGTGAVVQHVYPTGGTYTALVTATNSVNSLTAATPVTITAGTPVSGLLAFNDGPTPLGSVTTLSATVESGSGVTYTWAFGDGAFFIPQDWPDSGQMVTHTYPAVGTYTATVTATNRAGQVTATTTIVVQDAPIAGLSATNDSPTGLGAATTLQATVTAGSNISFTWDLGDGHSASGSTVTHTYPDVGVYTATVTATNSINTHSAFTVVTIVPLQHIFLPLVLRGS